MKRLLSTAILAACCSLNLGNAQAQAIRAFEPDTFKQIVASHEGKPFVVLLWSLDCAYCAPSFAALVDAKRTHGLEVVTIAADPVDDPETVKLISKKLSNFKLTGNAWAFGASPPEQLRYTIDPKWRGELPRSYWFGRDGKMVAHSGLISKELVATLMAK